MSNIRWGWCAMQPPLRPSCAAAMPVYTWDGAGAVGVHFVPEAPSIPFVAHTSDPIEAFIQLRRYLRTAILAVEHAACDEILYVPGEGSMYRATLRDLRLDEGVIMVDTPLTLSQPEPGSTLRSTWSFAAGIMAFGKPHSKRDWALSWDGARQLGHPTQNVWDEYPSLAPLHDVRKEDASRVVSDLLFPDVARLFPRSKTRARK